MKIQNLNKQAIIDAIEKIENSPELRNGRESILYDLEYNGNKYPPILVISEANKLLGGSEVTLEDFGNSTNSAFKVLQKFGFNVIKKNIMDKANVKFSNYNNAFHNDLLEAGLLINKDLTIRFIASLLTKPFVILTGLSGSGKTQLALAFAKWISSMNPTVERRTFEINEEVRSSRVIYKVTNCDKISVTFTQTDSGTKAHLPYELIYEWIDVIKEFQFTRDTPFREIRDIVNERTKYSTQLNSFETHLKAAAFHLIEKKVSKIASYSQVCIVPVGADWTNREPLLGFPNALMKNEYSKPDNGVLELIINASRNSHIPYFLILDEMNLSHVERYFADFLSVMESKEPVFLHAGPEHYNDVPPTLKLPDNLFIIGTVNIDETTYMFSPKVLDRANVIEFRVDENELKNFMAGNTIVDFSQLEQKGLGMAEDFLVKARTKYQTSQFGQEIANDLIKFFNELKQVGAEFGYRTASEILRFAEVIRQINTNWTKEQILDAAVMQKLLPKLHGSRRKLEAPLKALAELCLYADYKILASDTLNPKKFIDFTDTQKIKLPISLEKIRRMNINLINNNFTSYAEA